MSSRSSLSRLLPLGLLGAASLAVAGSWGEFEAAFPTHPCQDGWSGCVVDGKRLSPGMVLDDKGRPHPSSMRFGFFDFDALPALSPFEPLSDYTGAGVQKAGGGDGDASADASAADGLADAAPPPEPVESEETRRAAEEARQAAEQAAAAAAAEEAARKEQEERAAAEAAARKQAEDAERAAAEAARKAAEAAQAASDEAARKEAERQAEEARKAAEEARRKAEAEAKAAAEARARAEEEARRKAEAEAEAARKAAEEEAARKAAAEEAARKAEEEARLAAERAAADEAARKAAEEAAAAQAAADAAVADAAPPPAGDVQPTAIAATCDNLVALEVPAMMGQLGTGVRSCLEDRLNATETQTERDKISRVLIADAEARRDQGDWERLMKRHLENIDRSDPNLCFKYALHLSRGGASRANGVIRWADYALENKQQWQGGAYTKNVNGLYKIRAQAANKLWQAAEKSLVEDRNDETEARSEKYRGMTKDYSREWLDYARAAGLETSTAMALCVSAAGSKEFCGG